jgi:hypothetical protein
MDLSEPQPAASSRLLRFYWLVQGFAAWGIGLAALLLVSIERVLGRPWPLIGLGLTILILATGIGARLLRERPERRQRG